MSQLSFIETLPFYQKLIWFFGLSVLGWILSKLITLVWEKALIPLTAKVNSSLDDHLAKNTRKPVTRLMLIGSVYLAVKLTIATVPEFKNFVSSFGNLIYVLLVIIVAGLVNGVLRSFIDWYMDDIASKTESQLDDTLFPIFRKAGMIIIYFLAATVILGQFKVNLTGFLATAGVASLAVAFGAQETLSNVIAGISLLVDRSYHIGERIELKDGLIGDVVDIGLRSTRIMSLDKRLIIVPNKEIAGSRLINLSQPDSSSKIKLAVGVGMSEDLAKVKRVITEVCNDISYTKGQPLVILNTGFGPYSIDLLIIAEIQDFRNAGLTVDLLVEKLQQAFIRENIQLPFPQQYIEFKQV